MFKIINGRLFVRPIALTAGICGLIIGAAWSYDKGLQDGKIVEVSE